MSKWFVAITTAPILMVLPMFGLQPAQADEIAGTILSIDSATGTFALDDGSQYTLADNISQDELEIGMEVLVTYEVSGNGGRLATYLELMN